MHLDRHAVAFSRKTSMITLDSRDGSKDNARNAGFPL